MRKVLEKVPPADARQCVRVRAKARKKGEEFRTPEDSDQGALGDEILGVREKHLAPLMRRVEGLKPYGDTPLARTMYDTKKAFKEAQEWAERRDGKFAGKKTLLVLTDGEDNCYEAGRYNGKDYPGDEKLHKETGTKKISALLAKRSRTAASRSTWWCSGPTTTEEEGPAAVPGGDRGKAFAARATTSTTKSPMSMP